METQSFAVSRRLAGSQNLELWALEMPPGGRSSGRDLVSAAGWGRLGGGGGSLHGRTGGPGVKILRLLSLSSALSCHRCRKYNQEACRQLNSGEIYFIWKHSSEHTLPILVKSHLKCSVCMGLSCILGDDDRKGQRGETDGHYLNSHTHSQAMTRASNTWPGPRRCSPTRRTSPEVLQLDDN